MAWEYSEKTMKLFMAAVHGEAGTHLGEIENADGLGEHGSIACGDALRFTFRVDKHGTDPTRDIITECRYLTFGCTSAIAASEALCILIEQRHCTPIEALQITNEDIVEFLEGLPDQKIHCSVMGAEALEAAVFNWSQKRGVDLKAMGIHLHEEDMEEGRIVCKCFSASEPYIRRHIVEQDLHSIADITNAIKAGGACMSCHHAPGGLQDILDDIWGRGGVQVKEAPETPEALESVAPAAKEVSAYQLGKMIDRCVEKQIRPILQNDGGDIQIVDIKEHLVYCQLTGACAGCAGAATTLKLMVERSLKDSVDERIRVIAV